MLSPIRTCMIFMGYAHDLTAYESFSSRIQSSLMQPNIPLKYSSLFVATEMSPLLGIQNAGIRDQLPLQRKSVQSRCFFGLEQQWEESHIPDFHAYLTVPRLCLTFTACSETTSVPALVSMCTNGL